MLTWVHYKKLLAYGVSFYNLQEVDQIAIYWSLTQIISPFKWIFKTYLGQSKFILVLN